MNMKNKIIELEGNEKFLVTDVINYDGKMFLLLGKLTEDKKDIQDDFVFGELINNEVEMITDNELINKLVEKFKENLK